MSTKHKLQLIYQTIRYNQKIVFGSKFVYFLVAALSFFLVLIGILLFADWTPREESIYGIIILPGLLIVFYPVIYNIQNDKDSRMLEIVFSIPNYRYKIYLIRFVISLLLLTVVLTAMTLFSVFAIISVPVVYMVYQLMFPLLFMACLSFLFTTLVKNASGAAVIMVIIGLFFWIMSEPLEYSKWNIFLFVNCCRNSIN